MKYGKDLISRGASTTRTPAMTGVIFANLRGTPVLVNKPDIGIIDGPVQIIVEASAL
jgi:hypothetical protein